MRFKKILLTFFLLFLSTTIFGEMVEKTQISEKNDEFEKVELAEENKNFFYVYDPFENINRRIYYFNSQFDKYILLPIVDGYKFITPTPLQRGVHNFFVNNKNINTTTNSLLQLKLRKSMRAIGRFTINFTMGLGGLFDVASSFGMPNPHEDFGLTLSHYGVGNGPYLVLPILGPSTLRDALGSGIDTLQNNSIYKISTTNTYPITAMYGIDKRANINFKYFNTGSPFEYEYVRTLYIKMRELEKDNDYN